MREIYTINNDFDYVFVNYTDAVAVKEDLSSRFPDEDFDIYTLTEDDSKFSEYAKYVD